MTDINRLLTSQQAFILRLATGAIFGLVIASLDANISGRSFLPEPAIWRETLSVTLALVAFVIWAGAGAMRRISLAVWTLIAFVGVGYMCWFVSSIDAGGGMKWGGQTFLLFPLLFIAHELVSSGDQAGTWIAPYETYFDEAWKRGVQLALAILFTLLFWGILSLGAALLGFIGFDWLKDLLQNRYFSWPITGLAFGAAVHLGDVQTKLLANVRSLILGVLAWLLPVITLIGTIFAASLVFSGLAPLWATKAATATLLSGCIGFVLLINAAYQQGDTERPVPMVLKWCVRVAAVLLLIFAVLAIWSLGLRITQYGLSSDRIFAGIGVIIAVAYGLGYSAAVFVPGRWMARLEGLNIGLAIFKCVLFIAVLTPIATPARLSVNDQVARLAAGKVTAETFDWWLLKDETGVYGKKALAVQATSSDTKIATKAKAAIANTIGDRPRVDVQAKPTPLEQRPDLSQIPVVFPKAAKLPPSFLNQDFTSANTYPLPGCLMSKDLQEKEFSCKAALLDLNRDGEAEVLIRQSSSLFIFGFANGAWVGSPDIMNIEESEADFDAGMLGSTPAEWQDVVIGDRRHAVRRFSSPEVMKPRPPPPASSAPSK